MPQLTCSKCGATFSDAELHQRNHRIMHHFILETRYRQQYVDDLQKLRRQLALQHRERDAAEALVGMRNSAVKK